MTLRRLMFAALTVLFVGCATARQKTQETQAQSYEERVNALERELALKDDEILELRNDLYRAEEQLENASAQPVSTASASARLSAKEVQTALKKAGFYDGAVDGKIGKNTKKAITEFQKANGLVADGIVGKKTSEKLRQYLN